MLPLAGVHVAGHLIPPQVRGLITGHHILLLIQGLATGLPTHLPGLVQEAAGLQVLAVAGRHLLLPDQEEVVEGKQWV